MGSKSRQRRFDFTVTYTEGFAFSTTLDLSIKLQFFQNNMQHLHIPLPPDDWIHFPGNGSIRFYWIVSLGDYVLKELDIALRQAGLPERLRVCRVLSISSIKLLETFQPFSSELYKASKGYAGLFPLTHYVEENMRPWLNIENEVFQNTTKTMIQAKYSRDKTNKWRPLPTEGDTSRSNQKRVISETSDANSAPPPKKKKKQKHVSNSNARSLKVIVPATDKTNALLEQLRTVRAHITDLEICKWNAIQRLEELGYRDSTSSSSHYSIEELAKERNARIAIEDMLTDVRRELKEPCVVPQMIEGLAHILHIPP